MTNLKYRIVAGAATVAILATTMAPATFAAKIKFKNTGAGSVNHATIVQTNNKTLTQYNGTAVVNIVGTLQNTGGNSASGNTGDGNVTVGSGNATSTVTNKTTTGGNDATVNPCGCPTDDDTIRFRNTGAGSVNNATIVSTNTSSTEQTNETFVLNGVLVAQNTGLNSASGNTGDGNVTVGSGNATSTVSNTTTTGGNTLN
ncbi:MAG: hypothetical protein AAB478_03545 [Patescibacteria group bacterium]